MRAMKNLVALLVSLTLTVAAPAKAASSKPWEDLSHLKQSAPIQVFTKDHADKGEYVSCSTETLTIRTSVGEKRFPRAEVERVVSRTQGKRVRNILIGAGVGAAIGLATDQTLGTLLRNEGHLDNRGLMWALPIALGAGIGAAFPSYPVIYRK